MRPSRDRQALGADRLECVTHLGLREAGPPNDVLAGRRSIAPEKHRRQPCSHGGEVALTRGVSTVIRMYELVEAFRGIEPAFAREAADGTADREPGQRGLKQVERLRVRE